MFFLFSGEGPTDLGTCTNPECINKDENYLLGPLAFVVDQLVEEKHHYSIIDANVVAFVPRAMLKAICKSGKLKPGRKISLPDNEESKETELFFRNARALAYIAKEYADESKDEVVGILFADTDKNNDRGNFDSKYKSMLDGFAQETFSRGVPMIPKPVSEAWFLCAIDKKQNPNMNCSSLEEETYGSGNQHQLKNQLENKLAAKPDREILCEKVKSQEINFALVDLESYKKFKNRLHDVI